jgi:hypothetical protein
VTSVFLNFVHQAYLCVHLGTTALDGGHHKEAAEHFNTAVKANAFTSQLAIRSKYQDFVVVREHSATVSFSLS